MPDTAHETETNRPVSKGPDLEPRLRSRITFALTLLVACAPASPSTVACDTKAVGDSLFSALRAFHTRNPVPGASAAIVSPGRWREPVVAVVGVADDSTRAPLTTEHAFLAGSVGKTFWAAMALQLAHEGRLDLDAPISLYFTPTEIPGVDAVTPRMLMLHTTGFPEYDATFMEGLVRQPLRERVVDDWLGVLRRSPRSPMGQVRYSDLNYVVLALALDRALGAETYAAITSRLVRPLGLRHTRPALSADATGLTTGHDGPQGLFGSGRLVRGGLLAYNPQFELGGGGFISTPADLAQWMAAWRDGRAVPAELWPSVIARHPGQADSATTWKGLGVDERQRPGGAGIFHTGYIPGYLSFVEWFESEGVAVALQVNSSAETSVPDDPMIWLDSVARGVARQCPAP